MPQPYPISPNAPGWDQDQFASFEAVAWDVENAPNLEGGFAPAEPDSALLVEIDPLSP